MFLISTASHLKMKVVRVVGYHQDLQLDEAPEPKITTPLDVIVKIGAAGVCRFVSSPRAQKSPRKLTAVVEPTSTFSKANGKTSPA